MKTMDTMETRIKDDEQFAEVTNRVINDLIPDLLNKLMHWKKPEDMPDDIAKVIARICAICVHLNEYIDSIDGDDDEQPNLLN